MKNYIYQNDYLFIYLDSYFIGGFKYDGKAVFGVIETSERIDTVRFPMETIPDFNG